MKFKGKKAIMAAALSAIAAANSFGTAITASAENYYGIAVDYTYPPSGLGGFIVYKLVDDKGNEATRQGISGKTYTQKFYLPPESGKVFSKIYIKGDESSAIYPNSAGYCSYTFVMPEHNITIYAEFKDAPPVSSTPNSKPVTPTPSAPTPTPTNLRGDADVNGVVNVQDATLVLKHAAKLTKLTGQGYINADVNNDGNINVADATEILKIAAKLA